MATPIRPVTRNPAPAPVTTTPARPAGYSGKPAGSASPLPARVPAPVSIYAGVQTRGTRPDAIPEGCVLEVTLTAYYDDPPLNERGQIMGPPWGKIHFSIDTIEKAGPDLYQRKGDTGVVLISLDPKTRGMGPARVKEALLAFAGFDGTFGEGYTEADFDELDPNMTIIDAAAGRETLATRAGITIIGRRARLVSKRGKPRKPTKEGEIAVGYYVEYAWSALDETPLEIPAPLTPEDWAAE